jgi:hypothetical protein
MGISMNTEFGQEEMQVLARSLGSSLRSLSLRKGVIKPSFWLALSQHLPQLRELGLMHKVKVNTMGITAYLRTVTQPFTLYIGRGVLADHIVADLANSINARQLQGVSVKQEYPADERDFRSVDALEETSSAGNQQADVAQLE